ncbi:hypothetical protein Cpir12675_006320 [Ceratocystis pirilliformis]|uniref:Lipoprotein n=1 Tax=Ceratocystis pirilliformis TaxID=259994 RepID=A0ABR3YJ45_9PEZI
MRFHSLLSLGLMLSPFGSCRPGISNQETNGLENTIITDVSHSDYLESHGYYVLDKQNGIYWILSNFFDGLGAVVKISIDTEYKSATILDNYLDQGIVDMEKLKLPQIFQGFCYKENIPCNEIKSITMDIDDWSTHRSAKNYRLDNSLSLDQEFQITANQRGWEVFLPTTYYKHATEMLPGIEAEKITIKQERRGSESPKYAAVIAEVMMVSFKQPELKDE